MLERIRICKPSEIQTVPLPISRFAFSWAADSGGFQNPGMKTIPRRSCLKNLALAAAAVGVPLSLRTRPLFAADPDPQPAPTDDEQAAIAAIAAQFMEQCQVPGFSVAVARRGQFVYKQGFGFADTGKQEKVTPSHRFRIA